MRISYHSFISFITILTLSIAMTVMSSSPAFAKKYKVNTDRFTVTLHVKSAKTGETVAVKTVSRPRVPVEERDKAYIQKMFAKAIKRQGLDKTPEDVSKYSYRSTVGYRDAKGKLILEPFFLKVLPISDAVAYVQRIDGSYSFADLKTGDMIPVPENYERVLVTSFSDKKPSVAIAQTNIRNGYFDIIGLDGYGREAYRVENIIGSTSGATSQEQGYAVFSNRIYFNYLNKDGVNVSKYIDPDMTGGEGPALFFAQTARGTSVLAPAGTLPPSVGGTPEQRVYYDVVRGGYDYYKKAEGILGVIPIRPKQPENSKHRYTAWIIVRSDGIEYDYSVVGRMLRHDMNGRNVLALHGDYDLLDDIRIVDPIINPYDPQVYLPGTHSLAYKLKDSAQWHSLTGYLLDTKGHLHDPSHARYTPESAVSFTSNRLQTKYAEWVRTAPERERREKERAAEIKREKTAKSNAYWAKQRALAAEEAERIRAQNERSGNAMRALESSKDRWRTDGESTSCYKDTAGRVVCY